MSQSPIVNAVAVGFDKPFIVVNSAAIDLLDRDERRVLLAHELGHIMSGHATYTTLALIILSIGFSSLPVLGLHRASHPARAPRVVSQGGVLLRPRRASRHAGSRRRRCVSSSSWPAALPPTTSRTSTQFIAQAPEYEQSGGALDTIFRCSTPRAGRTRSTPCARPSCSGGSSRRLRSHRRRRLSAPRRPATRRRSRDDYSRSGRLLRRQGEGRDG